MSSIKNTQIDGDVSVGRNVAIGGGAVVQGNLLCKGGIKVEGWLDAKNIKTACKGFFGSEELLDKEYPRPLAGWFAFVIDNDDNQKGYLYIARDYSWKRTNDESNPFQFIVDSINVYATQDSINAEIVRAQRVESELQSAINSVVEGNNTRDEQINELQNAINDIEIEAKENEVTLSLSDFKDGGSETAIPVATEKRAGVMSAEDKQRLDTVVEESKNHKERLDIAADDNETRDEQIGELQSELRAAKERIAAMENENAVQEEGIATLNGQVAALSSGLKLSATLSPSVVYRGEDSAITVTPTLANNAGSVKAEVLTTILGTQEQSANNVASKAFSFNAKIAEPNASVTSSATYKGMTLTTKSTLYARYPIYMGAGSEPSDVYGTSFKQPARISAGGYTYKTTTNSNNQRFYLLVPTDVTQPTAFSMGGAPLAMGETTDVTLNEISYKVYKSANAYNSGTVLEIKVE